jgi:hypothetical protein
MSTASWRSLLKPHEPPPAYDNSSAPGTACSWDGDRRYYMLLVLCHHTCRPLYVLCSCWCHCAAACCGASVADPAAAAAAVMTAKED